MIMDYTMLLGGTGENIEIFHVYFSHGVLYRVGVGPRAGAQLPFEIKLCAFTDIALGHVGLGVDHHYAVPLRTLGDVYTLGRAAGALGCGKGKLGYRALLHVANLRVTPHIAHKYYFIDRHLQ